MRVLSFGGSFASSSPTSPWIKVRFSQPLFFASSFAFSMEEGTISSPITSGEIFAKSAEVTPIPQKASMIRLGFTTSASFATA